MKYSESQNSEGGLKRLNRFGVLLLSLAAVPLNGAFELVNDYEDDFGNTLWKQYGFGGAGTVEVVADPVYPDSGNNVIALQDSVNVTNNVVAVSSLPVISDGTTGTVFFRFALDETDSPVNGTLSVGPVAIPDGWADDENLAPRGWGDNNAMLLFNSNGTMSGRSGATPTVVADSRRNLTWYKAWYIVDTAGDTYSLYLQGGRYAVPTKVVEDFAFRKDATGEDIQTLMFFLTSGSEATPTQGILYADDIYVDTAGENLADPTPSASPSATADRFALVTDYSDGLDSLTWSQAGYGTGSVEVVSEPIVGERNVNNQVLKFRGGDVNTNNIVVQTPIHEIPDNELGTVFLRFAVDSTESPVNGTISISPLEAPNTWGDNNVMLLFSPAGNLQYRDGANGAPDVVEQYSPLTWYKAWFLVDNETDVSSLYLQGGDFAEPTLVAEDYPFRKDAAVDGENTLKTLMFLLNSGGAAPAENRNGPVYIDDIHVDVGMLNLSDPTDILLETRPQLGILKTNSAITIDGTKDGAYTARGTAIERSNGGVDSAEDLSATMHGAWDNDGLYLFVDVTDDVFSSVNEQSGSHRDDSIEIYFDPNMRRAGNLNGNTAKIVVHPKPDGSTEVWPTTWPNLSSSADFSAMEAKHILTDTGYAIEVFVPWAGLQIDPTGDWDLGLGIQLNDNDGVDLTDPADGIPDKEGHLVWGIKNDPYNFNTQNYGVVTLWAPKETLVAKTNAAIVIDGTQDAAYGSSVANYTSDRWTGADPHPTDTDLSWRVLYDDDNLYLFLNITDSVIISDSPQPHRDDSVELFLDGNNSKGGNVDGVDDLKFVFHPQDDGSLDIITASFPSNPSGIDFSGLEAAHVITETGWSLEIKVPFSTMKFDPVPGAQFGIDIAVSDDDHPDPVIELNDQDEPVEVHLRDGTLTWSAGIGQNNRTDAFGTATLFAPEFSVFSYTEDEITVDGNIDAAYDSTMWNPVKAHPAGGRLFPKASDFSAVWAGVYDDEHLHVIVDVVDNDYLPTAGTPRTNGAIEFYFDPSNNSSGGFDGVEDVKINVGPGETAGTVAFVTTANFPSPPANTNFEGLDAAIVNTPQGWRMEVRFPLATLRLDEKAKAGWSLGIDLQMADNDFGVNRKSLITWSGIAPQNFNTQQYGTVFLDGSVALSTLTEAQLVHEDLSIYESWMGNFVEKADTFGEWVYHVDLGWLNGSAARPWDSLLWVYSPVIEAWIGTSSDLFPILTIDGSSWVYLDVTNGEASLYDFETETWSDFE